MLNITHRSGDQGFSAACSKPTTATRRFEAMIDTAKKLEGMVRNAGVHAAGVVISPKPLTELVPLHRTKNDEIVTAFDMVAIEKLGLLKMDFLGLTTLTILDDALKLIEQVRGAENQAGRNSASRPDDLRKGLPQRTDLGRVPV